MSNNTDNSITEKTSYDIHERIYDSTFRVIKLVNSLPKTSSNVIIIPQILRCVTSMGANDQEADGTLTKKDFVHCYTIVRKENKETNYWLRLISDTNPMIKQKMGSIIQEGQEIVAIISSIINKSRM